jgi:hypothetical protein
VREIKHETRELPTPNPLRTAVCCDIFDKVSRGAFTQCPLARMF